MVKGTLVNVDIETGAEVLGLLEQANVNISVALWLYPSDRADWFLVMASRQFDQVVLQEAYKMIRIALDKAGFPWERRPETMIKRLNDPLIRDLRRTFGKTKSVQGMRIGGHMVGDQFIEDGYVYRIS